MKSFRQNVLSWACTLLVILAVLCAVGTAIAVVEIIKQRRLEAVKGQVLRDAAAEHAHYCTPGSPAAGDAQYGDEQPWG